MYWLGRVNDTPPGGSNVLDVVGLLRGGLDVVTAGRVVAVSGVVVTDGTVLLEVVVATFAGSDVDVDAEGKPVVDFNFYGRHGGVG